VNAKNCSAIVKKSKGHYVLVLRLMEEKTIEMGRLGTIDFPKGYYCYVGSAQGPGGLASRVGRHLGGQGKPGWHVDYLRRFANPFQAWLVRSEKRLECLLAKSLRQLHGGVVPVAKFGSSDCKCPSHLYHFSDVPTFEEFAEKLQWDRYPIAKPEKLDLQLFSPV
jgi:Uri superfamily endonuclease